MGERRSGSQKTAIGTSGPRRGECGDDRRGRRWSEASKAVRRSGRNGSGVPQNLGRKAGRAQVCCRSFAQNIIFSWRDEEKTMSAGKMLQGEVSWCSEGEGFRGDGVGNRDPDQQLKRCE